MPKMKTHRGAAKRFRLTGGGKFARRKGYKSHKLAKKTARKKQDLRKKALVSDADEKRLRKLLPYA